MRSRRVWGFSFDALAQGAHSGGGMLTLRPFQAEAIRALRDPVHLICVAPTGSGKSLIYERLAVEGGLRLLLVSPLIALARQQAQRLEKAGVPSVLGAGSYREYGRTRLPDPETGAWIVSPEMLGGESFGKSGEALRRWRPDLLVVDECHCLWDWGWDFRPSFRMLPGWIERLELKRSLWLTATLPPDARADLRRSLPEPRVEQGRFHVPETLTLEVARVPWPDRASVLGRWVSRQEGEGIVFVHSRDATVRVSRLLTAQGVRASAYHAGLSAEERRSIEKQVQERRVRVVVATSAFGMGMDFPHLRWTVLWQAVPSLLALAQAVGRVGRAGAAGQALVLWDDEDLRSLAAWTRENPRRAQAAFEVARFLRGSGRPRDRLESYFNVSQDSIMPRTLTCPVQLPKST